MARMIQKALAESDTPSIEYFKNKYKGQLQSALVQAGASLIMWLFAVAAYVLDLISNQHFFGVSSVVLYLIAINLPTLWVFKRIQDRDRLVSFSIFIDLLKIIGYTAVIYFLGGIEATYLTVLYAAVIANVGYVSKRWHTFLITGICIAAYNAMIFLEGASLIPWYKVNPDFHLAWSHRLARMFVVDGLLLVVAYITSYTAIILRKIKGNLLEAKATLEQRVQKRTQELETQVAAKEQALIKLAAAQSSLLEISRAAGMAEVATGVLHNVGNVLNSVNVSCTIIMDQLRESRVGNVARMAGLITESGDNIERFLTEDPRGLQIPAYLTALASALQEEHHLMLKESTALHDRIEHIKEIVNMQQTYCCLSGVLEIVPPEQLMEDALKLNTGALGQHGITVKRQYQPVPPITVDKHNVLQILLNLINNAKHACTDGSDREKIITLQIFSSGHDCLSMQVSDNGMGILPENLTRIFHHGFTTRMSGHGFGLHSGSLVAKELGGNLTAHSDGLGLGATFTLELPCHAGDRE